MSDEPDPTRVLLVRHGESMATVRRVIGGPRTCGGLSDLGRRQAERLRERLEAGSEPSVTRLISSGYPRALQTTEIIAPSVGLDPVTVADFGEHDPGPDCDGMSFEAFIEAHGMPDWETDRYAVSFPGGETIAEFQHRVGAALSDAVRQHAGETLLVTCHGGVIDTAFRYFMRTPMTGGFELHTVNTSITEFVQGRPGRWRLVRYNDAAHLAGLPPETPRE